MKKSKWQLNDNGEFRILSIEGGGIRGIFPAQYLAEIEKETGEKINEYFDLIVGTSTGGIIALALGVGIEAKDIVEMYKDNAKKIFRPSHLNLKRILKRKYDNSGLEEVLKEKFGDKKMNDSKVMLCITSTEFNNAKPKVYKTEHNNELYKDGEKELWKVAMATSAAPTYFSAAEVFENEYNIDGGLWANNPSVIGIAEAIKNNVKLENIKVLSIGTGKNIFKEKYKIAKKSSAITWNRKIIDFILNAQAQSAVETAKYLLGDRFTEINFELGGKFSLDSTDENSIKLLLNTAITKCQNSYRVNEKVEEKFFK